MEHDATITVLRFCGATTAAALLREVEAPNSMDHGVGGGYNGLCVAVEAGQEFDPSQFVRSPQHYVCLELDVIMTPDALRANIHTQGFGRHRTMWRLRVRRDDIIGLADRVEGAAPVRILSADGVLLRQGANVIEAERV